LNHKPCFIGCK